MSLYEEEDVKEEIVKEPFVQEIQDVQEDEKEIKQENTENKEISFEIEGVQLSSAPVQTVRTEVPKIETQEEIKDANKKKKKSAEKGYQMIAKIWVSSHDTIFKKLGCEMTEEEKEMLQKNGEAALEHLFPALEGKMNPVWALIACEVMIILPRYPEIMEAYEKQKQKQNMTQDQEYQEWKKQNELKKQEQYREEPKIEDIDKPIVQDIDRDTLKNAYLSSKANIGTTFKE